MKKSFLWILVIILLVSPGCSFLGEGQVKEEIMTTYDVKYVFGKPKKVLRDKTGMQYDKEGNKVKEINFDNAGQVTSVCESKYDQNNREISLVGYDGEGKMKSKDTYEYDDRGDLVEEISYYSWRGRPDTDTDKYAYKYDENNNKVGKVSLVDSKEIRKEEYRYDEKGNLAEEINYNHTGEEVFLRHLYGYDDKGNETSAITYDGEEVTEDNLRWVFTYSYDDKGNLVSRLWIFVKDGEAGINKYSYNRRGEIIKTVTYEIVGEKTGTIEKEENLKDITTYEYKYYPRWFFFF